MVLLDQLPALRALGRPILVGPSRKRFLGAVSGLSLEERDRVTATAVRPGRRTGSPSVSGPCRCRDARNLGAHPVARSAGLVSFPVLPTRPPSGSPAWSCWVICSRLAPTVTFWDAGEFIAAAKTLGIPHPPGTPLFVLIAHVWAMLFPIGEYAFRTNLLSALLSALGAGCFFLVAHESLRALIPAGNEESGRVLRIGGGAAAALLGAFTFTNWQNSNETEVYAVATFTIAAMSWLAHLWRRDRATPRASRLLLLIVYLAGVSIGNHLLALLAGPGDPRVHGGHLA